MTAGRSGPMVEVAMADGERLRVHQRRAITFATGDDLDAAALAQVRRWAVADRCERRALRLLAIRGRSRSELAIRFRRWGLSDGERDELLERLAALGLLDDAVLATQVSGTLRRRGHGHLRARADLDRLGVGEAVARTAEDDHAATDRERAEELIAHRFGPAPLDGPDRRRAAAFLGRRGFDAETVAAVLRMELDSGL
jgi:regulatory protein